MDDIQPQAPSSPPDLQQSAEALLKRHDSDAITTIAKLLAENYGYRERLRELKDKVPGEDAAVLTKEQAAKLEQYSQLGEPDDIAQLRSEVQRMQRESAVREMAGDTFNAKALLKLVPEAAKLERNGDTWQVDGVSADEFVASLEQTLGVPLRNKPVSVGTASNPGGKPPPTAEQRKSEALRTGNVRDYVAMLTAEQVAQKE